MMTIQVQQSEQTITLRLEGEIDHAGAEALKQSFGQLSLDHKTAVIFDFKNVRYIGSAGLGKLLLFYKRLSAERIQLRVESPSPTVRSLLKELKMDTLFAVS
ncbi:MAG: STAS domain-containing protein [Verrucomicrobiota bacterium]